MRQQEDEKKMKRKTVVDVGADMQETNVQLKTENVTNATKLVTLQTNAKPE